MKRIILLLIGFIATGCGTFKYYHAEREFLQCERDYKECNYEANKSTLNRYQIDYLREQCMELRGYKTVLDSNNSYPNGCDTIRFELR